MNTPRRRLLFASALTALGCAAQPGPNRIVAGELLGQGPALAGTVSLRVEVALPPSRSLQQVARRWQPEDVKLLRVKLLRDDGAGYVDTGLSQDLDRKVAPIATGASFVNMAAGKKYRASVEAWGEAGGASAAALLNANSPSTADFDFTVTPGQDLGASRSATVNVQLDAIAFSGTARVAVNGKPGATNSVEAQLWVQGGGSPVATQALGSNVGTAIFGGLRAGPDYEVKLRAKDASEGVLAEIASTAFRFDPAATGLEQTLAFGLNFPGASPGASPSPSPSPSPTPTPLFEYRVENVQTVTGLPTAHQVAPDGQGQAWVGLNSNSVLGPRLINAAGALVTLPFSAMGAAGVAVEATTGELWVDQGTGLDNSIAYRLSSQGAVLSSTSLTVPGRDTVTTRIDAQGVRWVGKATSVSSFGNSAGLLRLGSNLNVLSTTALYSSGSLGDVAFDAEGNAWVSFRATSPATGPQLAKLNSQGLLLSTVALPSTGSAGCLALPNGEIWVAITATGFHQILRLNTAGVVLGSISAVSPYGLARSPDGTVWVSHGNNSANYVSRYTQTASLLATYATGPRSRFLAVGSNGTLWVPNNSGTGGSSVTILRPGTLVP